MRIAWIALLASTLAAQTRGAKDLFSEDWRVRNEAARALATAPIDEIDLPTLLRALATEYHGRYLPRFSSTRWTPPDPRAQTKTAARQVVGERVPNFEIDRRALAPALVAPWRTAELAAWILRERMHESEDWQTDVAAIAPCSPLLADIWLRSKPQRQDIEATLLDARYCEHVASELGRTTDRQALLRGALIAGSKAVQDSILSLADAELLNSPDLVKIAVDRYLHADEGYQQISPAVKQLGSRAVPVLAANCDGPDSARVRALAMLTMLGEQARAATSTLISQLDADRWCCCQALVALTNFEIPTEHQAKAAERAMLLLEKHLDLAVRLLACDLLANCGDGVTQDARKRLQAMLLQAPSFWRSEASINARLLACLHRLRAMPDIAPKRTRKIAQLPSATTGTWLAVAAEGKESAAFLLAQLRKKTPPMVDAEAVMRAIAKIDLQLLHQELGARHGEKQLALEILMEIAPTSIEDKQLLELAEGPRNKHEHRWLAAAATRHLAERATAATYADRILAAELARPPLSAGGLQFLAMLDLPPADRVTRLTPALRLGHNWQAVADADSGDLRRRCRTWLAATVKQETRRELLTQLCRLGLETDDDLKLLKQELAKDDRAMTAVEALKVMPAALRHHLEARLDETEEGTYEHERIRDVLLAHTPR